MYVVWTREEVRTRLNPPPSSTAFTQHEQKLCEQQYPEIEDFDFPGKVRSTTKEHARRLCVSVGRCLHG